MDQLTLKEELPVWDVQRKRYEPSRHLMDFHIAGFTHGDGLEVIDQLVVGAPVLLIEEPDNPYDAEAIAIYFEDKKIGYVPKDRNSLVSKFLYFGHRNVFEAKIQCVHKERDPERQIRVALRIRDGRTDAPLVIHKKKGLGKN